MYAAIDEQDKIYTSGSETYAQIQPMTSEVQRPMQHEQTVFCQPPSRTEEMHPAPQPPSVDSLRHVAHAHSRQGNKFHRFAIISTFKLVLIIEIQFSASSSSANSSIVNPGSPKPEKRQANSPLPPPPEATAEGYASVEKRGKGDDRSRSSLSVGKSLEDMYAKVMKKKREVEEQRKQGEQENEAHPSSNSLYPDANTCRKLSLIEISRASWCSHESVEIQKKEPDAASNFHGESDAASTSRLPKVDADTLLSCLELDYGYEAVNSGSGKRSSAARGAASTSDPNYEMLRPQCSRETDYPSNLISARNSTDAYSVPFKHRQVSNASSEDPGYEKVRLRRRVDLDQDTDSEPNYESMPHDPGEPNYASVCRPGDSDTDPNYESVNHGDPNYESVKYMSVIRNEEPPYEQVNNFPPDANADGYEKVRSKKKTDVDYERINPVKSSERISNGGDTDDEQYVQV